MTILRLLRERCSWSFFVAFITLVAVVVFGLIGIGSDQDLQQGVEEVEGKVVKNTEAVEGVEGKVVKNTEAVERVEGKVAENTEAVEDVGVAVLSSVIPRLEPGSLIELANSSGRVYRIEFVDGASVTIRHIASPNLFEASGCEWHKVIQLDAAQVVALVITVGAQLETVFDC